MDYEVRGGHGRLGEISVEEFDCVGEEEMLGDGTDHMESLVLLESRANVESMASSEVP